MLKRSYLTEQSGAAYAAVRHPGRALCFWKWVTAVRGIERLSVLFFTSSLAPVTSLKQVVCRLYESLTDISHDLRHEGSLPELRKGGTAESMAKCWQRLGR